MGELTHLDEQGRARMVDVGGKPASHRQARARVEVHMSGETWARLQDGSLPKGDAGAVCRLAGIMAAKRTWELIPLCHPLTLTHVEVSLQLPEPGLAVIESEVACTGPTGVEMEALTAASVAALTLYDMLKACEKGVVIGPLRLEEKSGGRSGHYQRSLGEQRQSKPEVTDSRRSNV